MSVSVQNISKFYGEQKAVDNISFEVKPGEIVGFLGPNGAGKSTTMKILTCYIPQSAGVASVCGFDVVTESREVRKRVGYLPEHNPLYTDMFVKEYLQFAAKLHGIKEKINEKVEHMIAITGLEPEKKKKIGQLSKGYRQRVGLAQAMIHDPEVLILDEPTSGLDPNQLVEIRQLIREIGKNKAVILSTHIMQEVEAICNRVIIINKGQIVADDKVSVLQSNFKGAAELIVKFKEEMSEAKLSQLPGVTQVTRVSEATYRLLSSEPEAAKEAVFKLAIAENNVILSLTQEEQKLESIFREITGKKKKK